jgi:nitronate monooxygenase
MPRTWKSTMEGEVVATGEDGREILRYSNNAPIQQIATGNPEGMALYAGQGTGMLHKVEPAARIVCDLAADAERVPRELCSL